MKKPAKDFKTWLIWTMRKASYRWPPRSQAFRAAQVSRSEYVKTPGPGAAASDRVRNFYRCALCKKVYARTRVSADHIKPVVDPKRGWQDWEEYLQRLFCEVKGFQIICSDCHDQKTKRERRIRTKYRKKL